MLQEKYMQQAIEMAAIAKGVTSPNPTVGAVIVQSGNVVSAATHLRAGEAHAEVRAIEMAGTQTQGSTLYVTLEPCSHYGKTPPCVKRIIEAGIKQVYIAMQDPNPLVAGRGIALLREAGIGVEVGLLAEEARLLNEDWSKYITTGLPYVTVKTAMTLDGKIATRTGQSKWITGDTARAKVQRLRHISDAIMVGVGTVLADDPSLTTRGIEGGRNPIRVIIDSKLETPLTAKVVTDGEAPTWIFTEAMDAESQQGDPKISQLTEMGVEVFQFRGGNLIEVLKQLAEHNITSVLLEGGSELIGSFFDQRLIDKYIVFIAPKLIGGREAKTSVGGLGIADINLALEIADLSIEQYGNDICISGYPKWSQKAN
jgi:diaminohydroxyphosphoribosylaminopyrimidine deaminase/5-amino-6-(5-phosphoribosylamino)uracil reductase